MEEQGDSLIQLYGARITTPAVTPRARGLVPMEVPQTLKSGAAARSRRLARTTLNILSHDSLVATIEISGLASQRLGLSPPVLCIVRLEKVS